MPRFSVSRVALAFVAAACLGLATGADAAEKPKEKPKSELNSDTKQMLQLELPNQLSDMATTLEEMRNEIKELELENSEKHRKSLERKIEKVQADMKDEVDGAKKLVERTVKPYASKIDKYNDEIEKISGRMESASDSDMDKLSEKLDKIKEELVLYEMQKREVERYLDLAGKLDKSLLPQSMRDDRAPDFSAELLTHDVYKLSDNIGDKVAIITLFSTFNRDSVASAVAMGRSLSSVRDDKIASIAVAIGDDRARLEKRSRDLGDLIVAMDSNGLIAKSYKVTFVPQFVVVDADGKIRGVYTGNGSKARSAAAKQASNLLRELNERKD